mgnify:CR=1 FL=1|jgi:hypothetical protein
MNTVVSDMLLLLHEDWMPEKRKESIRNMLMSLVDNMETLENEKWQ